MAVPLLMPALSPTMTEGNLAKWSKKIGDKIAPGDIVAEIETDKAMMEMEAVDAGVMAKILVPEGSSGVKINTLIAVISESGDSDDAVEAIIKKYSAGSSVTASPLKVEEPKVTIATPDHSVDSSAARVFASPLAKRIASQNNVPLGQIQGSGPYNRVIKADVESFIANSSVSITPAIVGAGRNAQEYTVLPISSVRKVIAKRLLESKQTIPHFYVTSSCQIDELMAARKTINDAAEQKDGKPSYKLSVNDFVIKAVAKAMKLMPIVNSSWTDSGILQYNNVDISIAVSTDGGLITPIVKNADQKSIVDISEEMKGLAVRARANKLKPEEFQGGGFSISNLGMYGIKTFDAIINPPQSCIMAVGAGIETPIVKNGKIEVATVMEIRLSCDHRIIDGAVAAEFANLFKKFIENPILMLA